MKKYIALFLCIVMCASAVIMPTAADTTARDVTVEESYAAMLKSLGLFKGVSETDFDLKRAPTRVEALVMLIRVLGEEKAALEGDWEHPFADVVKWADPYVGYAYETGLTKGVSATQFGTGDATAAMYLTFMLRALGYTDVNNEDFSWNDPYTLAKTAGILTDAVDTEVFWRADAVTVSYEALAAYLKSSDKTLAGKLIEAGVFTKVQYNSIFANGEGSLALNADDIAQSCSPAIFNIDVYSYNGKLATSGYGFFISENGYAVTNFHVAGNNLYMVVTTASGEKYDDVIMVDAIVDSDLALIRVKTEDTFPYLKTGNPRALKEGESLYVLDGTDNVFESTVVTPKHVENESDCIKISEMPEKCGGAVVDGQGNVVGIAANLGEGQTEIVYSVYIDRLDLSKKFPLAIWKNSFYEAFEDVYDFGAFTGMNLVEEKTLQREYTAVYDAGDIASDGVKETSVEKCLIQYKKAMRAKGFSVEDTDKNTTVYKLGKKTVTVTLSTASARITVLIETELPDYSGLSGVPDAGAYFGLDEKDGKPDNDNGKYTYVYKWSDKYTQEEFKKIFIEYIRLLEKKNFVFDKNTDGTYVSSEYTGQYKKNYVVECRLDSTNATVTVYTSDYLISKSTDAYNKLKDYLLKNGTYSSTSKTYDMEVEIGRETYSIALHTSWEMIAVSSIRIVPGYNTHTLIMFSKPTKNVGGEGILPKFNVTYTYLTANTTEQFNTYIDPIMLTHNTEIAQSGSNTNKEYIKKYGKDAISSTIITLEQCEQSFFNSIGITLADLGFICLD